MPFNVSRVAIIGAGPSGLASAKHLLAHSFSVTLFEQQPPWAHGGVWHYTPEAPPSPPAPQTDPFLPPDAPLDAGPGGAPMFMSAMYEELHANIPGSLMAFKDRPFPKGARAFPSRKLIKDYVLQYAEEVRHLVRFSREVVSVTPRSVNGDEKWDVTSRSTVDGSQEEEVFDAVVVANGHYSVPFIPAITNLAAYSGAHPSSVIHSKQYRSPRAFDDKTVVVVGNGPSGLDIAYQIKPRAKQLYLSVRTPTPPEKISHIGCPEIAEIVEFLPTTRGIRLSDGTEIHDIDTILFCTGFLFSFPFLPTIAPTLITKGKGVHGLYKHLFCIAHPTLAFSGLLIRAVPFPVAEAQAAAFSAVWSNLVSLPPADEMWEESRRLDEERGDAVQVLPKMADAEYINDMHDWVVACGGKEPPRWEDRQLWERKIFAEAKIRFEEQGCKAETLEELGFRFGEGGGVKEGPVESEP
ncbi:hypothetical protein VUR80DRAFT_7377 [Thermomyces stellatus]